MSNLDETNFRAFAQEIINKYDKKKMLVDALLWARVIALYEDALAKLTAELASARKGDRT